MKPATRACLAALAAAALSFGCARPERSRDLANPAVSARTMAQQVCSNCHGMAGSATSPNFPNLAGQTEPYVIAQLHAFKRHGRSDPAGFEYMWGLSRSLTDEQITGLAAYYAAQLPVLQPIEGDRGRFEAGKSIFVEGVPDKGVPACATCHGLEAKGNAIFPRLAGQHADYLWKQLMVFQRTDQRPEGSIMKTVAHELTPQNMRDVAGYLQALPAL
ncbi:c-type cytochrome [soil metagenome]